MVAVSIIGLFAAVVFVSLGGSRAKARDAVRSTDLKNLSLAAEQYFAEHGSFATSISNLDQYFGNTTAGSAPTDPSTHNLYSYVKLEHGYCVGGIMETNVASPSPADSDCPSEMGNYIIKGPKV